MEILIKASQFILSLSLLIVLHELGHFIPAKIFKTKVEKFYLFFDYKFSIIKKKIGETVYGIGWIPLGGYVKIAGMIDESMDKEQLKQEPKPWEFRSKPAWQRLIIMLGGVLVNFILGIFIYIMLMYSYGEQYLANKDVKDGIWVQDSLATNIGLQNGDKILTIDGQEVRKFGDITLEFINGNRFTLERNGEVIEKDLPENFISLLIDRRKNNEGPIALPRNPFMIAEVPDSSANVKAGFLDKDIVVGINGKKVKYYDEVEALLLEHKGQDVSLDIRRNDEIIPLNATVSDNGKLEVIAYRLSTKVLDEIGYYDLTTIEYSFSEAIPAGFRKSYETLASYVKQLKKIFNPKTGAYKGLGGFISIGSIFPEKWSAEAFWNITAFLSIMLGFMNLLPIPALDGGHVMFTLWEMITRRKPSDKFLEYAQVTGFIILIALLLFANGNDIFRLFQ